VGAAVGALLGAGVGAGAAGVAAATAQANVAGPSSGGTGQQQYQSSAADFGYDSMQTTGQDASGAGGSGGTGDPATTSPIPQQQAWPDIEQHSHQAVAPQPDPAHLEPSAYDDGSAGGSGLSDGSGAGSSGSTTVGASGEASASGPSYLDIQDLLPEEP